MNEKSDASVERRLEFYKRITFVSPTYSTSSIDEQ